MPTGVLDLSKKQVYTEKAPASTEADSVTSLKGGDVDAEEQGDGSPEESRPVDNL